MLSVSTFIIILLIAYIVVNAYMQTRDMKLFCVRISIIGEQIKKSFEHINIQEQRQEAMYKCITELKNIDKTCIERLKKHNEMILELADALKEINDKLPDGLHRLKENI